MIRLSSACAFVSAALIAAVAIGQQADRSEVEAWLTQEWQAASAVPNFGDMLFNWTLEHRLLPSDQELRNLQLAVDGKPDHPQRPLLEAYERRLAGEDRHVRQLYFRSLGQWRLCTDLPIGGYIDASLTKRNAWELSAQQLTIVSPSDTSVSSLNLSMRENVFVPELMQFVTGALFSAASNGMQWSNLQVAGDGTWSLEASWPEIPEEQAFVVRMFLRWDESAGRGFIERSVITKHGHRPDSIGSSRVFADWRYSPAVDRWLAHRVEYWSPEGDLDRELILGEIRPLDRGEFEVVTARPHGGTDPVRGETTFARVSDYVKGVTTDGDTVLALAHPVNDEGRVSRWTRPTVWIPVLIAAGAVGLLAWRRVALRAGRA